MPDILAHPLSAFGPIHGTYPKFRRSSRPQLVAAPPHLYPEQNRRTLNAAFTRRSAADTRVQRNHRLRKRKRNLPPSPSHQPNPHRPRNARKPAALSDDRPSETDLSRNRKPQRTPDIPQQSSCSCQRKCGAALDGRTTRRRTWPSGAPGDRNVRWRPSRCARTARRRAPGTRGSGGCSGPRS